MKTSIKTITLLLAVGLLATACNKTRTNSNRLIKGGEWTVTELSVDGTSEAELPSWEIEDCEIYDESCHAEWANEEGGHAEFCDMILRFRAGWAGGQDAHQLGESDDEVLHPVEEDQIEALPAPVQHADQRHESEHNEQ